MIGNPRTQRSDNSGDGVAPESFRRRIDPDICDTGSNPLRQYVNDTTTVYMRNFENGPR